MFGFDMAASLIFQSTPLIRGATEQELNRKLLTVFQSTPLIRGATGQRFARKSVNTEFQSTPLIRGATAKSDKFCESLEYFNPRPSYEERRVIISQV